MKKSAFICCVVTVCIPIYSCQKNNKQKWTGFSFAEAIRQARLIQNYISVRTIISAPLTAETVQSNEPDAFYDSLRKVWIDTTTLYGKRKYILNLFMIESEIFYTSYDSLFDLNYDGYNDYVIGYYGQCGTGIKNRNEIYFYDTVNHRYIRNDDLSGIANLSFYIKQKKITGFYIALGCGSGCGLEWKESKWITTKEFEVCEEGDTSKWYIFYPLKKAFYKQVRPYQMIPPPDILETKIDF